MDWTLRKPHVTLNVRPIREWDARRHDPSRPIAGLSPAVRAVHRARRARECIKVLP